MKKDKKPYKKPYTTKTDHPNEMTPDEQKKKTDPQEDEKNGNFFGEVLDMLFGDKEGGHSISDDEADDPNKQSSIKE